MQKKYLNSFTNQYLSKEEWGKLLSKTGNALSVAPDQIKENKSLVIKAIKRSSLSIEFASNDLKDDLEVAHALLDSWGENYHSTPKSFLYLSERIKSKEEIVEKAMRIDLGVYRFLKKEFLENPDYYLKVFLQENWADLTLPRADDNLDMNSFLKMDLTSLSLVRRINIADLIFGLTPHRTNKISLSIFSEALTLKILNLNYWEINHYDEIIFWRDFPKKREKVYKKCQKLGEKCISCNPPF